MSNAITVRARIYLKPLQGCSLSGMCLPLALHDEEAEVLDNIVKAWATVKKGELLFDRVRVRVYLMHCAWCRSKPSVCRIMVRTDSPAFIWPGTGIGVSGGQ